MSRILITGSSSGFGLDAAILARERGDEVFGTVRSLEGDGVDRLRDGGVTPIFMDVNDDVSVERAMGIVLDGGRLDAVVNNAGIMLHAPVEETSDELARRVFETNFFGALRVIRAVLPSFRSRGGGVIVNVSSTAGLLGLPGHGAYAASKQALEGLSESLHSEVEPFGIKVRLIEPGTFPGTRIEEKALSTARRFGSPYESILSTFWRAVGSAQTALPAASNVLVAHAIWEAVHNPDAPFRQAVGLDAQRIVALVDAAPFENFAESVRNAIDSSTAATTSSATN